MEELVSALRIVIVNGPRQSGKTTMLKEYQRVCGGTYRTLDDRQTQESAREDPIAFARFGDAPRLIDEVHRGGDWLVRAIKMEVDEDRAPGQFILSGSKLTAGIVLHLGPRSSSYGDGIYALPLSALWGNAPLPRHGVLQ